MRVLALNIEEQAAQWVVAENMKRSKLTTADKKVFSHACARLPYTDDLSLISDVVIRYTASHQNFSGPALT